MCRFFHLLASACASFLLIPGAFAQVPDRVGFFAAIDGRWTWLGGDLAATSQQSSSGPAGQALIGYKFSEWDAALAGDVQGLLTTVTHFQGGLLTTDTTRQHVDIEAGYSSNDWRLSFGLRGFHFFQRLNYYGPLSTYYQRDTYGVGPKLGFGGRLPLADSSWAVVGGANAALLAAQFNDTGNGVLLSSRSYWMLVPELDGEIGLNWHVPSTRALSFTVGARAAAWFNTAVTLTGSNQDTWLELGPFVRMAYNFGGRTTRAPTTGPQSTAQGDAAGPVICFAFDETTIGPVATGVLRQAAMDAASGRPVNLSIRGTAEDGDTAHERQLAAARAAMVKQHLERLGLTGQQIVLAARSDAVPLAPVAPYAEVEANRRVQIIY